MELRFNLGDDILGRFANSLGAMSEDQSGRVLARALNHEGDKKRTQVLRALAKQTGIKYGRIRAAVRTVRAGPGSLTYRLDFDGVETNIGDFSARQTKKGVSAAPWGVRRIFPHTFIIKKYGGRVFKRTGAASDDTRFKLFDYRIKDVGRFPIRGVFGPNMAREVTKGDAREAWDADLPNLADRVGHEIEQELIAAMTGLPMGKNPQSWAPSRRADDHGG